MASSIKPVIKTDDLTYITGFDCTDVEGKRIDFSWDGTGYSIGNIIRVYQQSRDTNGKQLVYEHEYNGTALFHVIPKDAKFSYKDPDTGNDKTRNLENIRSYENGKTDKTYTVTITVKYQTEETKTVDGVTTKVLTDGWSEESDEVFLWVFARPTFYELRTSGTSTTGSALDTIFDKTLRYGTIVRNSTVGVKLHYEQNAGVPIQSYEICLYHGSNKDEPIQRSGKLYTLDTTYSFTGLVDGDTYYVTCFGETVYGMQLQLTGMPGGDGFMKIIVRYETAVNSTALTATNVPCEGYIKVNAALNANIYEFDYPEKESYINNTAINLWNNGLTYTNSTGIMERNAMVLQLSHPIPNRIVYTLTDADDYDIATITYHEFEEVDYDKYPALTESIVYDPKDNIYVSTEAKTVYDPTRDKNITNSALNFTGYPNIGITSNSKDDPVGRYFALRHTERHEIFCSKHSVIFEAP